MSPEDVSALLVVYDVTGADRQRLLTLAREVEQPGWWEARQSGLPSELTALIEFEAGATRISNVAMILIPGLLQIGDYTRAVMIDSGVAPADVESRVATRLGRQAILSRQDPPALDVFVDEAALRRCIGGPAVMARQLRRLIDSADSPNVAVRVLRNGVGAHPGVNGSFVVLFFPAARTIVHLEHRRSSLFLDSDDDTAPYVQAIDRLAELALGPSASVRFLSSLIREFER